MSTEVIAGSTKGSLVAVLGASKAFVVAHPMGMAVAGGAFLGMGGLAATRRYFSKRKQKREAKQQILDNAAAVQAA